MCNVKCRWKGEREEREREKKRKRNSLLIRTRHKLGYLRGVYRRCMESGTNTVGNVPSLRMMDDRGRLYRQTIWKSRYGGGSNSIWWNGESKAEVFANGPVLNVRLLEGCFVKKKIIIFLWIEIEFVFFFFFYWITFERCIHWIYRKSKRFDLEIIAFIVNYVRVSEKFLLFLWIIIWSLSLSYFVSLATAASFLANRKWDKSKKRWELCVKRASAFLSTR